MTLIRLKMKGPDKTNEYKETVQCLRRLMLVLQLEIIIVVENVKATSCWSRHRSQKASTTDG